MFALISWNTLTTLRVAWRPSVLTYWRMLVDATERAVIASGGVGWFVRRTGNARFLLVNEGSSSTVVQNDREKSSTCLCARQFSRLR